MDTAYTIAQREFKRLRLYCESNWGKAECERYHKELDQVISDENQLLVLMADITIPAMDQNKLESLVAEQLKEKQIKFNMNDLKKITLSLSIIGSAYRNEYGL